MKGRGGKGKGGGLSTEDWTRDPTPEEKAEAERLYQQWLDQALRYALEYPYDERGQPYDREQLHRQVTNQLSQYFQRAWQSRTVRPPVLLYMGRTAIGWNETEFLRAQRNPAYMPFVNFSQVRQSLTDHINSAIVSHRYEHGADSMATTGSGGSGGGGGGGDSGGSAAASSSSFPVRPDEGVGTLPVAPPMVPPRRAPPRPRWRPRPFGVRPDDPDLRPRRLRNPRRTGAPDLVAYYRHFPPRRPPEPREPTRRRPTRGRPGTLTTLTVEDIQASARYNRKHPEGIAPVRPQGPPQRLPSAPRVPFLGGTSDDDGDDDDPSRPYDPTRPTPSPVPTRRGHRPVEVEYDLWAIGRDVQTAAAVGDRLHAAHMAHPTLYTYVTWIQALLWTRRLWGPTHPQLREHLDTLLENARLHPDRDEYHATWAFSWDDLRAMGLLNEGTRRTLRTMRVAPESMGLAPDIQVLVELFQQLNYRDDGTPIETVAEARDRYREVIQRVERDQILPTTARWNPLFHLMADLIFDWQREWLEQTHREGETDLNYDELFQDHVLRTGDYYAEYHDDAHEDWFLNQTEIVYDLLQYYGTVQYVDVFEPEGQPPSYAWWDVVAAPEIRDAIGAMQRAKELASEEAEAEAPPMEGDSDGSRDLFPEDEYSTDDDDTPLLGADDHPAPALAAVTPARLDPPMDVSTPTPMKIQGPSLTREDLRARGYTPRQSTHVKALNLLLDSNLMGWWSPEDQQRLIERAYDNDYSFLDELQGHLRRKRQRSRSAPPSRSPGGNDGTSPPLKKDKGVVRTGVAMDTDTTEGDPRRGIPPGETLIDPLKNATAVGQLEKLLDYLGKAGLRTAGGGRPPGPPRATTDDLDAAGPMHLVERVEAGEADEAEEVDPLKMTRAVYDQYAMERARGRQPIPPPGSVRTVPAPVRARQQQVTDLPVARPRTYQHTPGTRDVAMALNFGEAVTPIQAMGEPRLPQPVEQFPPDQLAAMGQPVPPGHTTTATTGAVHVAPTITINHPDWHQAQAWFQQQAAELQHQLQWERGRHEDLMRYQHAYAEQERFQYMVQATMQRQQELQAAQQAIAEQQRALQHMVQERDMERFQTQLQWQYQHAYREMQEQFRRQQEYFQQQLDVQQTALRTGMQALIHVPQPEAPRAIEQPPPLTPLKRTAAAPAPAPVPGGGTIVDYEYEDRGTSTTPPRGPVLVGRGTTPPPGPVLVGRGTTPMRGPVLVDQDTMVTPRSTRATGTTPRATATRATEVTPRRTTTVATDPMGPPPPPPPPPAQDATTDPKPRRLGITRRAMAVAPAPDEPPGGGGDGDPVEGPMDLPSPRGDRDEMDRLKRQLEHERAQFQAYLQEQEAMKQRHLQETLRQVQMTAEMQHRADQEEIAALRTLIQATPKPAAPAAPPLAPRATAVPKGPAAVPAPVRAPQEVPPPPAPTPRPGDPFRGDAPAPPLNPLFLQPRAWVPPLNLGTYTGPARGEATAEDIPPVYDRGGGGDEEYQEGPVDVPHDRMNPGAARRENVNRPIRDAVNAIRLRSDQARTYIQENAVFQEIPLRPGRPPLRRDVFIEISDDDSDVHADTGVGRRPMPKPAPARPAPPAQFPPRPNHRDDVVILRSQGRRASTRKYVKSGKYRKP